MKKKIERGEDWPSNCSEAHWKQLHEEATIERAEQITKIYAIQKNASLVGRLGDHSVEERMVSAFPLANLFSMFMLMVKWIDIMMDSSRYYCDKTRRMAIYCFTSL